MAVLTYTVVRVHPEDTIDYIVNPDKIIPGSSEDISRAINYMGDENSVERVYSFGHHCSANPKLAQQQFAMYRQRYLDYKNGAGIQGCTDSKQEALALHFFLSYDKQDPVTEEKMNYISRKLDEYIGDFPCLSANHWDREHKHTHKLVGQYSVSGTPHKFAMKHKDLADVRRYVNRLCYEQGLSVIDLPELREYDKEYSHWLDGVIAEGKVRVIPANDAGKDYKGKSHSSRYHQWVEAQKRLTLEEEKLLTEKQLAQKRAQEKYFFELYGCRFRSSSSKKFYSVRKYDETGRKRSTLELLLILMYVVCKNEQEYILNSTDESFKQEYTRKIRARRDYKVQAMVDSVTAARKYRVNDADAVKALIADTGKQMNALKIEKAKHDSRIKSGEALADALRAYRQFRSAVECVAEPNEVSKEIYNEAYSIMAAHKCTTPDQIADFWVRYNFSVKKSAEYETRLAEQKKKYRELKRLHALCNNPMQYIDRAYELSAQVVPGRELSLEEKMRAAEILRKDGRDVREADTRGERD